MKTLMIAVVLILLAGCSTTPNTDAQWAQHDARIEAREHKAWCEKNDGVWIEDNSVGRSGNKCYQRQAFNEAVHYPRN